MSDKISSDHTARQACVYVRQSTPGQVTSHQESQGLQYGLVQRAKALGWEEGMIRIIDEDLGRSAAGCTERSGFQELLTSVCDGRIGGILAFEASRLARNGREWHTLLELCGVMDTVLIDQEAVYHPGSSNDRLLLGLKGELSSMELRLFRERSHAAIQQKAKRGELYLMIAVGYAKEVNNQLNKDPNRRVREVLELLFKKFTELGSIRQVFKWLRQEQIELPSVVYGQGERQIKWKLPNVNTVSRILTNPIYAGAYVFGRTKRKIEIRDGRKRIKKGGLQKQEDWDVLILDHHEGYISWGEYQANQEIIAQNANMKRPLVKGSTRQGQALLGGLLRCGHCGRKLLVRYQGRQQSIRYVCRSNSSSGSATDCIGFGGRRVDQAMTDALFEVVSPLGLDAAVQAINRLERKSREVQQQYELALEQAHYEAQRVKRQYDAVEPENRLVATELERTWNKTLAKVAKLEQQIADLNEARHVLTEEDCQQIMRLAQDLPHVWKHPSSSWELKKRILRTVAKEVVVYLEDQKIELVVHWEGGDHTKLQVQKNRTGETRWTTDIETTKIITGLARVMPDKHIVSMLNRIGRRTAKGLTWTPKRIRSFRKDHKIPVHHEGERQERREFTVDEASEQLGIGITKVRRLIQHRMLPATQLCAGAPWIIAEEDLRSEVVRKAAQSRLPTSPLSRDPKQEVLSFNDVGR